MKTNEYYGASLRHKEACLALMQKYDESNDARQKKSYLCEAYYLSGYVLETIMSWAIFRQHNYSGDIYNSNLYKEECFKTHNLQSKANAAIRYHRCQFYGLMFLDKSHKDRQIQKMYTDWSVDFRYQDVKFIMEKSKLDKRKMYTYLNEIFSVQSEIIKKYYL